MFKIFNCHIYEITEDNRETVSQAKIPKTRNARNQNVANFISTGINMHFMMDYLCKMHPHVHGQDILLLVYL